MADGFSTHRSAGDANRNAYLGCQIQRPDTRVFAEDARTLVQESAEPFARLRVEDLMGRVWSRGFGPERAESSLMKIMDGITDGLIGAANETGYQSCRLSISACYQPLATPDGKALG